MMTKEIKTAETTFDIENAMTVLRLSIISAHGRLNDLYASVNPKIVWYENASVKEARRISAAIKTVIDNLQNTEGLADDVLDREINHLNDLYASVNPKIVWHENASVKEARRISSEVEVIKNKLIYIKALIHEIDAYYDAETE